MLATPDAAVLEVLQDVRERTRRWVSVTLPDLDALTIALTCGMVEATALIQYAQERTVRTDAVGATARLKLSDAEFIALFGTADPTMLRPRQAGGDHNRRLVEYEALPEATALRAQLEAALSTTLLEDAQRAAWRSSPVIRVAAQVALCRASDAAQCLNAVVGGMVRADDRRVDDLKSTVEDRGLDIMIVSQALAALASSVVS